MITVGLSAFKNKRVLLLQGPLGPFFQRLAQDLKGAGAELTKINFNGGDLLFYPRGAVIFRGRMEEWPAFFEQLLIDRKIDIVLLFGDCRPMHRDAHEIAYRRGLEIGVFEEGYIRPDYITLERFGVNGNSLIPRTPDAYLNRPKTDITPTVNVGSTYWHCASWAVLYYAASALLRPLFRHYRHHRPLTLWEALPWARGVWRKFKYKVLEQGIQAELVSVFSKKYFLVPLQVHNDAQVHVHSDFDSVKQFIRDVVSSFASHAPADTLLVIKHHPMDRGYRDHRRLIGILSRTYGIQNRVRYIHDQHLPTLLERALGVVVVNSTVGLSALHHGTPLKVCGIAIYDMEGLTFQGSLDEFWRQAQGCAVNRTLFTRFRNYVVENTQLNGSFYRRLKVPDSCAGLVWPQSVADESVPGIEEQPAMPDSSIMKGHR